MLGNSGRLGRRIRTRGAWLFAWLTLALLMALFRQRPTRTLCRDAHRHRLRDRGRRGPPLHGVVGDRARAFQNAEYDDGDVWPAKVGSKYGYFRGPASTAYSDITAACPISTDDSAITFWYYIDAP